MSARSCGDGRTIVTRASAHTPLSETLKRLQRVVREKGLEECALIDHSGAARRIGLVMQEAKLLIFASPKAGTPPMAASPLLALNLPLKILIWLNRDGDVLVSYNATSYLFRRHDAPRDLVGNVAGIDALVQGALGEA